MEAVPTEKLKDVLDFINEWRGSGDIKEACEKFQVDTSLASKYLNGKVKRPNPDFIKYLKDKAEKNRNKLRIN